MATTLHEYRSRSIKGSIKKYWKYNLRILTLICDTPVRSTATSWFRGINFFHAQLNEHEILNAHKYKIIRKLSIFQTHICQNAIFPAHKGWNANNCWHFNIYEQEKNHDVLSWAWKKFHNLGAWWCKLICMNMNQEVYTHRLVTSWKVSSKDIANPYQQRVSTYQQAHNLKSTLNQCWVNVTTLHLLWFNVELMWCAQWDNSTP